MKYFDAHAHYLGRQYSKDRDRLLTEMHKGGVKYIVNSTHGAELEHGLRLAKKYDFLYLSILSDDYYDKNIDYEANGHLIDEKFEKTIARLTRLCLDNKKIVAYGEFGMDFRRVQPTKSEVAKQAFWFKKDLEAARQLKLPVVIHSGNACQFVFDALKEADMPDYGHGKGMIHCYLGTPEMALEYIEMGYLISITGLVTHKSARGKNLVEVVKKIPLKNMVIETDSPYLTPEPCAPRARNDSSKLKLVVEKIAELKGISPQKVAESTTAKTKAFFGIS